MLIAAHTSGWKLGNRFVDVDADPSVAKTKVAMKHSSGVEVHLPEKNCTSKGTALTLPSGLRRRIGAHYEGSSLLEENLF